MDNNREPELKQLYLTLEAIAEKIQTLAGESQDNVHKLLCIMRTLEQLHRDIREDLFQPALPNNRHDLYNLLKDIEANGGWPYIHRMQLQELIAGLSPPDAYEQSLLTYSQDARRTSSTMQKYVCTVCGYEYDPQTGDPDSGIEPGTAFEDIPDDWVCPVCGASKGDFEPVS